MGSGLNWGGLGAHLAHGFDDAAGGELDVGDGGESQAAVEAHGRVVLLDVDAHRLAGRPRLVHDLANEPAADSAASMFGQQGDIDDPDLVRPAVDVQPADRRIALHDHIDALKQVDLVWEDGGAYALLGPSGCGKTTLLNLISGLLTPTEGSILFDGVEVNDKTPEERQIAQVFQFPVVYDTMTVYDNLAFPLRNRGMDEKLVGERVQQIAEMLDLAANLKKRASGLTADGKQKISLGRCLVRSDVNAILFDEPLTVIDPHLKWQLRSKLKELHQRVRVTMIYVTHDQIEAMTMADKIVVLQAGVIEQVGSPLDPRAYSAISAQTTIAWPPAPSRSSPPGWRSTTRPSPRCWCKT